MGQNQGFRLRNGMGTGKEGTGFSLTPSLLSPGPGLHNIMQEAREWGYNIYIRGRGLSFPNILNPGPRAAAAAAVAGEE